METRSWVYLLDHPLYCSSRWNHLIVAEMIMIPVDENHSLFVYGFNDENELVFKSSLNPQHIRHEPIVIREEICYVATYYFPVEFLGKLPDRPVDNQGVKK